MNRVLIRTVLLAAALGAGACSEDGPVDPGKQTGMVSGRVTAEGAGVPSAQVELSGRGMQTTDASGNFTFSDVPSGSYTVSVTAPSGFALDGSGSQSVTVAAGATQTVTFTLRRSGGSGPVTEVRLMSRTFEPASVTIQRGTTVKWINVVGTHDITPRNPSQEGVWPAQNITGTETFEHRFNTVGTFQYTCTRHAGMDGTVTVQ